MKKFVTMLLVAVLAVSAMLVLTACAPKDKEPRADKEGFDYVITGEFNDWKVNVDGENKLDAKYKMEPIMIQDARIKSISANLKDAVKIYVIEHTATNNKTAEGAWEAGWSIKYAITEGATPIEVDGKMAIKVIKTKMETVGGQSGWSANWLPDAGNTTFVSLTPDTLYMPPHAEQAPYENSGDWNTNPILLTAGTYYIVFAEFADGTFGLGAIAK